MKFKILLLSLFIVFGCDNQSCKKINSIKEEYIGKTGFEFFNDLGIKYLDYSFYFNRGYLEGVVFDCKNNLLVFLTNDEFFFLNKSVVYSKDWDIDLYLKEKISGIYCAMNNEKDIWIQYYPESAQTHSPGTN